MYTVLIVAHSWLRWFVLIAGVLAVVRALTGRSAQRRWEPADAAAGTWYTRLLDIQFLVGIILYLWASPITTIARQHMAEAMGNSATRFWLVEHPVGMIAALALAHIGHVRIKRSQTDRARFTRAALFYGVSVLITFLSTPWPGMPYGRSLLRLP